MLLSRYPESSCDLIRRSHLTDALYLIVLLRVQCLQAFEKISRRQPAQCLQAGMITAVLAYVDFFTASIQVRALRKASLLMRILCIC